ncbi:MAG: hypothetical protein WDN49_08740 [Acetobacteraceae bacterium]
MTRYLAGADVGGTFTRHRPLRRANAHPDAEQAADHAGRSAPGRSWTGWARWACARTWWCTARRW